MTEKTVQPNHIVDALLVLLSETFENVRGIYLDKGTSLFETLATISAEEASHPVSARCASLAAQVEHVRFYIDTTIAFATGQQSGEVDWGHIWKTVEAVTPDEWADSQKRLRETYGKLQDLVKNNPSWDDPYVIGNAIGVVAHTAYHLGEIRQALCTLKS
jgi:hypothetical protein